MKDCSLCGKENVELEECSYCEEPVCKDCMVKSGVGKVCKKCDKETARQINWDGMELEIE